MKINKHEMLINKYGMQTAEMTNSYLSVKHVIQTTYNNLKACFYIRQNNAWSQIRNKYRIWAVRVPKALFGVNISI